MNAILTHKMNSGKVERDVRHYRFIEPKKVEIDKEIWIVDTSKDELREE